MADLDGSLRSVRPTGWGTCVRMELRQANPRRQGDIGEAAAIEWLTRQGAKVWIPLSHSPDVDLIADFGAELLRVQVKTATVRRGNRYEVNVCTNGGNQSWNRVVKILDPAKYDFLFVLVGDGRRWFIPSQVVDGGRRIMLGGPKYNEFQVDVGEVNRFQKGPSRIDVPSGERRSGRAGLGCKPSASVLRGFESLLPHAGDERERFEPESRSFKPYRPGTRTRISPQHKITIPITPFRDAELAVGDRLSAESAGPGRVILTRIAGVSESESAETDEAGAA
jgi:hypothetical protein